MDSVQPFQSPSGSYKLVDASSNFCYAAALTFSAPGCRLIIDNRLRSLAFSERCH